MTTSEHATDNNIRRPMHRSVPKKLNRVGSLAPEIATTEIRTLGQRMTSRRLQLKLTQAQVAEQVQFQHKTGRKKGAQKPLSRNAYCMYEIGQTEPDLNKIQAIAAVLDVMPGWLAFGESASIQRTESRDVSWTGRIELRLVT